MSTPVVLEPAAQKFAAAASTPPFLEDLEPAAARKVLEDVQATPVDRPPVDETWVEVPLDGGTVRVRIVRPRGSTGTLPVVLYMHGGGWVLGSASTHDRFVRDLAVGAKAAVAFVEYTLSPEARYPVAIEQGYATARWITRHGTSIGLDGSRMAVADEAVAYAAKLRAAGVPVSTVRYDGTVHDFYLLNPLSQTEACRAAIPQATAVLRAALGTG